MPKTKKVGVVALRIRVVKDKEEFQCLDDYNRELKRIKKLAQKAIKGEADIFLDRIGWD